MAEQHTNDGGLQYVPQIAVQYVYLDFDGELTSYNGEILTVENVQVQNSFLTDDRIANILDTLNQKYSSQGVVFVTEPPVSAPYSTIFIGKTSAFDDYGKFTGLAETIDKGNVKKSDNAFVNLDFTATDAKIISTISHETDHLLGTLNHGGEGLKAYAEYFRVEPGVTSTGVALEYYDSMSVSSGGTANDTTVCSQSWLKVLYGGVANNTTINDAGILYVEDGGKVYNTTINYCGSAYLSWGGYASDTTLNNGGAFHVTGKADDVSVVGGTLYIYAGGSATNVDWTPCVGNVVVYDGAYVTYTSQYSGVYYGSNGVLVSQTESETGKKVKGVTMYVMSDGIVTDTIVDDKGTLYVENGGSANNTTVKNTGDVQVHSGGTVENTTLDLFGTLYVYSGGSANNTELSNQSFLYVTENGKVTNTNVNDWGFLNISSGGGADNTTVNKYGEFRITSAEVTNTTVNNKGEFFVEDGGCASNTLVNDGGYLYVTSGGSVSFATVNNEAELHVSSGGRVSDITVSSGAVIRISSGATACDVTLMAGGIIGAFTFADDKYFEYVSDGSVPIGTSAHIVENFMLIPINAIVNGTNILADGYVYVSSDGTANDTIVNADGELHIGYRAIASNTTTNEDGELYISSGGKHKGTMQIADGANVYVYEGGLIDFTLSGRTFEDDYLINDFSLIGGTPTCTITVSSSQGTGTYKLARGASDFSGSVSLSNGLEDYGVITVNGEDLVYNGITYSLDLIDGNLTFSAIGDDMTPPEQPTAVADITETTSGAVTITATFSADSAVKQYKIDDGEWMDYTDAVTVSENATVYFRAADEAGNISDVTEYVVDNIVKSATIDGSGMTQADAIANGYDLIVTTGGTYESNFGHDGVEARIEGGTFNCTVSGGALTSSADYKTWASQENETNLTITGGTFNKVVMGGDRVNSGNGEHIGDLNLIIEGGTFNSQIAGGMAYTDQSLRGQTLLSGDINMTLAGGTFESRIYGGCISTENYSTRTAIEGNINIVVDSSTNELIFADNVYIVAGSYQNGAIDGNVQVTFTGLGENLKMDADNLVWGGSSSDVYLINGDTRTFQTTISGTRTICFDDFTGEFNTGIRGFNVFTAENGSKLQILASNHLRDIEQWNLDWDTQLSGSFQNDFKGDTMKIDLTGWDQTATNLFDCAAGTFTGFDAMKEVTIGNETATYSTEISGYVSTNYMLTVRDNQTMQLSMNTTIA